MRLSNNPQNAIKISKLLYTEINKIKISGNDANSGRYFHLFRRGCSKSG